MIVGLLVVLWCLEVGMGGGLCFVGCSGGFLGGCGMRWGGGW